MKRGLPLRRLPTVAMLLAEFLFLAVLPGCRGEVNPSAVAAKSSLPPIKIGYMICNSKEETANRFRPLSAYLEAALGRPVETHTIDTIEFEKSLEKLNLDFTHTNSLLYVILNRHHGVEVVAGEKRGALGSKNAGLIVARKDSGIKSVRDLKGKRMAFGPMLGPLSYLAQYVLLRDQGVDPEKDLATYVIPPGSFKHEKVIYGVMFGQYDAGATPRLDFELMASEGRIDRDDFTIVASSEPLPYCTWAAGQRTDERLVKELQSALVRLTPETVAEVDGERVRVLKAAAVDGYEAVPDSAYDRIREMARRANLPPYQTY